MKYKLINSSSPSFPYSIIEEEIELRFLCFCEMRSDDDTLLQVLAFDHNSIISKVTLFEIASRSVPVFLDSMKCVSMYTATTQSGLNLFTVRTFLQL